MVMMEPPEPETARPLPPPTFSAPFAAPSLRWPSKKGHRCSYHAGPASSSLRFSPSRSPLRRISPSLEGPATGKCALSSAEPPQQQPQVRPPGSPLPPRSPTPSDRPRFLIRLRKPRREDFPGDEDGEEPPPPPPQLTDLSSAAPTEMATGGGEGEAAGRSLRSSSRRTGEEGETGGKRKWRVELWVPLSRGEIEEDFLRMTGSKPPRRCRLRRRGAGSEHLSRIFPGSWLPNKITADRYKVADPSNPGGLDMISQD